MTERLYYSDSYTTEFEAVVTHIAQIDGNSALVLDRTHFYPTSGGQPHDLGTLGGADCDRCRSRMTMARFCTWWTTPGTGECVGHIVHGSLDWDRRYDHMQQHAGQHLLSQTFYQLFGYETLSVHFGAQESTLDLKTSTVDDVELKEAERFANTLVFSNLPIRTYFVDEGEIMRLPLRRPPQVTGKVRIVEIQQFDWSACGGTHVRYTGEIGIVKVVKQERHKDRVRLTFLCGWRSVRDYAAKHDLLTSAALLFSNEAGQVPELIARSLEQNKLQQRRIDELAQQLLRFEADALVAAARDVGAVRVVVHLFDDKDADAVRAMASQLQSRPATVALLASNAGDKVSVVFAA